MGSKYFERISAKQLAALENVSDTDFAGQVYTYLTAGGLIPMRRKDRKGGLYVFDACCDPDEERAYIPISWDMAVTEAAEIAKSLLDHYTEAILERSKKSTATHMSDWRNAQTARRAVMIFRDRNILMI